ncbi:hypothetical protein [Streptomyces bauhiniae]
MQPLGADEPAAVGPYRLLGRLGSGGMGRVHLGTWEGKATALGGALPRGTFRVTVHQATSGKELGNLRQTDQLGGVCVDILTLKQVNSTRLLATSTGAETNHKGCDPAPHEIRLTPTGDDLTYTSTAAAEGNPEARLSKVAPDD